MENIDNYIETFISRDPRECLLGAFIGDNVHMFHWFTSVAEFLEYIKTAEPIIYDLNEDESINFRQEIDNLNILDDFKQLIKNKNTLEDIFYKKFHERGMILWIGSYSELLKSESDFAKEILTSFGKDSYKNEDDFIKFLSGYGY